MTETEGRCSISESMQMYLVTIARLRGDSEPVPLSKVAEALAVSPVSVNEMCRKLQDQGLLLYQPYKGASLTPEGERSAYYVLRRHRLWEVFLVENLGLEYGQAHEAACQLEHSTSDLVTDRLDGFLGHPAVNPEGMFIPRADGLPRLNLIRLTDLAAGERGHVVRYDVADAARTFLEKHGLRPGAPFALTAVGDDGLLLKVSGRDVAVSLDLAGRIEVEPES